MIVSHCSSVRAFLPVSCSRHPFPASIASVSVLEGKLFDGRQCCIKTPYETRRQPLCRASHEKAANNARKVQLQATELLAEMLKSSDLEQTAKQYVDSFTEEFFHIASTYLSLAKKEGNAEVLNQLELAIKTAMKVKDKTLRPEIQLMNQLLRDNGAEERSKTIETNVQYLEEGSYFFELLNLMTKDVERQPENPQKGKLLSQLRSIAKQTKEASKASRKTKKSI